MSTRKQKKAAPAPPTPTGAPREEKYVEARINGHEINREFLRLSVPDGAGGWFLARMRVPKRIAHAFKKNATVRVRPTDDPAFYERVVL